MNVLFVSEHDLCRGPMARVLAQKHARDMEVPAAGFDSAGVAVVRPLPPTADFIEFMQNQDLNIARHLSKPLAVAQVRWADLILCMTRDVAQRARTVVGPRNSGMIRVLNEAVRLAHKPAEKDIDRPAEPTLAALLAVFSRVKAATGRLVRLMSYGHLCPTDFGAREVEAESARPLDDPNVRQFVGRYIVEFIERAFESPTTADLLAALEVLGRPCSILDLEELIAGDLRQQVFRDDDGRWDLAQRSQDDQARARREWQEQYRRREEEKARERSRRAYEARLRQRRQEKDRAQGTQDRASTGSETGGESSGRARTRRQPVAHITEAEALDILSVSLLTPRGEALKTYRRLLMRFHPDKFHDDPEFRDMAEKKTQRINLAWSLLKDKLPEGE